MKRLKIFFRLKWDESKEPLLFLFIIIIGVSLGFMGLIWLETLIGEDKVIIGCLIVLFFCILMIFGEPFYSWIKSNWQKAGRIERGEE